MKKTAKEIEEIKEIAKKTLEWYDENNPEETGYPFNNTLKLDNFIKHLGIEPSISEGMFVANKFGSIVYARKIDGSEVYGYGIDSSGDYYKDDENVLRLPNPREATKQEVEEAFTKLARKMGYVKGITFKSALTGEERTAETDAISFVYNLDDFMVYLDGMAIFDNGKWAKIIEKKHQEMTVAEIEKALGKKIKIVK